MPKFHTPANFACYILFELWDGKPPPHPSGPPRIKQIINNDTNTASNDVDNRVLRIKYNPCPFSHHNVLDFTVQIENEINLGEFQISELNVLLNNIHSELQVFNIANNNIDNSMIAGEDIKM